MAKSIYLYLIKHKDADLKQGPVVSIVASKQDAKEFIIRKMCFDHINHFESWCALHNKTNTTSIQLQYEYLSTCYITELADPPYVTLRFKYTTKMVASLLRMAYNCVPTGGSYEDPLEVKDFLKRAEIIDKLTMNFSVNDEGELK